MRWGLKSNPFEWASHDHEMANRQAEWKAITKVLDSSFRGDICRFILAFGDYGMGKSFTLHHIYRTASKKEGVLPVEDVLTEKPIATRSLIRTLPEFDIPSRILANLGMERIGQIARGVMDQIPNSPFKKIIGELADGSDLAWKYLLGERLLKDELKELMVRSSLPKPEGTLNTLIEVLKVVKLGGYHTVLVLVDEFEMIMSKLGGKAAVSVLDTLRSIFDEFGPVKGRAAKLVFVFGVSVQAWDKIVNLERTMRGKTGGGGISPFVERILPTDKITLNPFTLSNALELVEQRLSEVRTKPVSQPLYPFTKEAVDFVYSVSKEKPRLILQYCYILLESAEESPSMTSIDIDFARRTLGESNIVPPDGSETSDQLSA